MEKKDLSSKDFLLALLYCPGTSTKYNEPVFGRTRLTKMVYLFEKEVYSQFASEINIALPEFEPYHFGPFSKKLFEDLRFFISIGFIETQETQVPISSAEKYENNVDNVDNDDCWECATFDEADNDVELKYFLSERGENYVKQKVWDVFTEIQKDSLTRYKTKINSISLDSLLNYVYNKYPEDTTKSRIADRYIGKDDGQC